MFLRGMAMAWFYFSHFSLHHWMEVVEESTILRLGQWNCWKVNEARLHLFITRMQNVVIYFSSLFIFHKREIKLSHTWVGRPFNRSIRGIESGAAVQFEMTELHAHNVSAISKCTNYDLFYFSNMIIIKRGFYVFLPLLLLSSISHESTRIIRKWEWKWRKEVEFESISERFESLF